MPKNNKKKNAFFFFMVDWRKQQEKKGYTFPNGLKDVQSHPECNHAWANLSPQDKAYYQKKEKESKLEANVCKMTSVGEILSEVEKTDREQKLFMTNMRQYILSMLETAKSNNNIEKLKFYVIHINYSYARIIEANEKEYYPIEIGLAEFSLEEGVTRTYEKIVNSKVHIGYASAAKEHSADTHQIPPEPAFGEDNLEVLYKEICEFLEAGRINGQLPPLYTLYETEDNKNSVIFMLNAIAAVKGKNFTVYSFEELFTNLHNIAIQDNSETNQIIDIRTVCDILKKDLFSYIKSFACEYHREFGHVNYCSISMVRRWICEIFADVCPLFGITLKSEGHMGVEEDKQMSQLTSSMQSCNFNTVTKGAIKKQIKSRSERTFVDEHNRKHDSIANPITIINYNTTDLPTQNSNYIKKSTNSLSSGAFSSDFTDSSSIDSYESNFPAFGQGSRNKRSKDKNTNKNSYSLLFK